MSRYILVNVDTNAEDMDCIAANSVEAFANFKQRLSAIGIKNFDDYEIHIVVEMPKGTLTDG